MALKSEIPFGAQFSLNQVALPRLLRIVHDHAGDRKAITEGIRDEFFATHSPGQRWKLADNTVLAARAYRLLGEDAATPTALARELLPLDAVPNRMRFHGRPNSGTRSLLRSLQRPRRRRDCFPRGSSSGRCQRYWRTLSPRTRAQRARLWSCWRFT